MDREIAIQSRIGGGFGDKKRATDCPGSAGVEAYSPIQARLGTSNCAKSRSAICTIGNDCQLQRHPELIFPQ